MAGGRRPVHVESEIVWSHSQTESCKSQRRKRGALVSRVTSDIETLTQFFTWGGLTLLLDGFQMLAVAIVMVAYDWRLAVVAFVVSAPLVFVLRIVQSRLITAHNISRERNAHLLGNVSEMLSGFDTLRAYDSAAHVIERVEKDVDDRARSNIRAGFIGAFLFPSGEVFAVFTVVAVVTTGLLIGPTGGLTSGALVGFVFSLTGSSNQLPNLRK